MAETLDPSSQPVLDSSPGRRLGLVGIGASAGGIAALQNFFSHVNADGVTATTGPSPTDIVFGRDTRLLFVLESGAASISSYRIAPGGALLPLGTFGNLPPTSSVGLAAY